MSEPVEYTKESSSNHNGKIIKFSIAGVLVAAVGVGTSLYLIQNNNPTTPAIDMDRTDEDTVPTPTPDFTLSLEKVQEKYGIACKRYESISDALQAPETACQLDLSGQNLTSVPKELLELKNLTQIDLSNNNLASFPYELLKLPKITNLNLSENNINEFDPTDPPSIMPSQMPQVNKIQQIQLQGNKLDRETIEKVRHYFGPETTLSFK